VIAYQKVDDRPVVQVADEDDDAIRSDVAIEA